MQSVSSRIWTRVAVSISYNDNDYTTYMYMKKHLYKKKWYEKLQVFCLEVKLLLLLLWSWFPTNKLQTKQNKTNNQLIIKSLSLIPKTSPLNFFSDLFSLTWFGIK